MSEGLLVFVGLLAVIAIAGILRYLNSPLLDPDEVEEEVENALDALLMYDMDEEDDE